MLECFTKIILSLSSSLHVCWGILTGPNHHHDHHHNAMYARVFYQGVSQPAGGCVRPVDGQHHQEYTGHQDLQPKAIALIIKGEKVLIFCFPKGCIQSEEILKLHFSKFLIIHLDVHQFQVGEENINLVKVPPKIPLLWKVRHSGNQFKVLPKICITAILRGEKAYNCVEAECVILCVFQNNDTAVCSVLVCLQCGQAVVHSAEEPVFHPNRFQVSSWSHQNIIHFHQLHSDLKRNRFAEKNYKICKK